MERKFVNMDIIPKVLSYNYMKESAKMGVDNLSFCDIFLNIAASMFEYNNADSIAAEWLEMYLLMYGQAAIIRAEDLPPALNARREGLAVCMAFRAGTPNENGLGRDLIVSTFDGRVTTIKDFETEGKDKVVYIKNNLFATPDFTIGESGGMLTEITKSTRYNVKNSRLIPLIVAKDIKTQKAIESALAEGSGDSYKVVVSDNILTEGNEFILKVTDVKDQDKIQYLNHAYDDELRHWYNLHGMDISGASKQAQQSVDEISSGTNSRKALPYGQLAQRKKGIERCNELFGTNIEVQFSLPWRLEFGLEETPVDKADNGETPEPETEETPESEGESEVNENVEENN